MKTLFLPLFLIFFVAISRAQEDQKTRDIEILSGSSISIHGDARITEFNCDFDMSYLRSPSKITYDTSSSKTSFSNAELVLKNKGFDCGSKRRNKDFSSMVKSGEYPEMKLELLEVKPKEDGNFAAIANVFIAGKENRYSFPVRIDHLSDDISQYRGTFNINIRDFGLEPIKKMFGLIKVKDIIQISLELKVKDKSIIPNQ